MTAVVDLWAGRGEHLGQPIGQLFGAAVGNHDVGAADDRGGCDYVVAALPIHSQAHQARSK